MEEGLAARIPSTTRRSTLRAVTITAASQVTVRGTSEMSPNSVCVRVCVYVYVYVYVCGVCVCMCVWHGLGDRGGQPTAHQAHRIEPHAAWCLWVLRIRCCTEETPRLGGTHLQLRRPDTDASAPASAQRKSDSPQRR